MRFRRRRRKRRPSGEEEEGEGGGIGTGEAAGGGGQVRGGGRGMFLGRMSISVENRGESTKERLAIRIFFRPMLLAALFTAHGSYSTSTYNRNLGLS